MTQGRTLARSVLTEVGDGTAYSMRTFVLLVAPVPVKEEKKKEGAIPFFSISLSFFLFSFFSRKKKKEKPFIQHFSMFTLLNTRT